MATLMARVKDAAGKFKQVAVKPVDGEYTAPEGATSFFVLGRDKNGKRIQIGDSFKTLEETTVALWAIEDPDKPTDIGIPAGPAITTGTTWEELKAKFIDKLDAEVLKQNIKPSTVKRYTRSFREFSAFLGSKNIYELSDITTDLFEDFKIFRIKGGAKHAFVADCKALNPVFEFALKRKMIAENPIEYESEKKSEERGAHPLTIDEIKAMNRDEVLGKHKLTFLLLYRTGFRRSDIMDLRWGDVGPQHIIRVALKNGKKVRVPITPDLKETLDAERENRNPKGQDFVLLGAKGKRPYKETPFYRVVKQIGERAGVKDVHPHRFRDTFAVRALMAGCSFKDVAEFLGDDVKTVMKFYSEYTTDQAEIADAKLLAAN
jgi:integrase/recombinase XerD